MPGYPFRLHWLRTQPGARESLWFGVALALALMLPALVAAYPQMSDYPSHLARYHVMLAGEGHPFLEQYYRFEWRWSGNLGADLLIGPLAALFGLETAGRLIVIAIPLVTGLSILAVEWTLRRRIGLGSLLALLFVWQPALLMGFLNYMLGLAAALFAFALWVRLEGRRWRPVLFVVLAPMVWLCHVSGWGVLGLLVFGYEWSRNKSWRAFLAPWPLTLPFAALLLGGGTKGLLGYGANPLYFKALLWERAMRDQVEWLDQASLAVVALVLIVSLARRRIDGRLGWAALIMLAGTLAMPRHIFGGDYVDYRLIAAGLLAACLALTWQAPRWILIAAAALFLGRLAVTTAAWQRDSRETAEFLTALDHVPQGARIASLVAVGANTWRFNNFEHIAAYATLRRDALVNAHFVLPGVHMLSLRDAPPGFRDPSQRRFVPEGKPVDLSRLPTAQGMDYLWYVGAEPVSRLPEGARPIFATRHSLLAHLAKPQPHR